MDFPSQPKKIGSGSQTVAHKVMVSSSQIAFPLCAFIMFSVLTKRVNNGLREISIVLGQAVGWKPNSNIV